ncbi:MAG: YitT family protein [Clostridia bacterium]|nr:YitT family protein [Clostridia bacterium]
MDNKKQFIRKYLIILSGIVLTAFAISVFYTPNKIVNGGVSGIATIFFHTLKIPTGITFFTINIILLLIGLKILGKRFVMDTILATIILSLLLQVFSGITPLTDDIVLTTIFGSALYGIGIGLTLSQGASTGGTDILGRIVQHFFPQVRIGTLLFIVDAAVITSSLIVFRGINLAMYGALALFISSYSINWLIQKLNISKLAFVITDKGYEISNSIVTTSPHGVTLINATGGYTMSDKSVLICAMKESEIVEFQQKVLNIDDSAFVIFSESQQILGNGFKIYK